jgi:hypothetical protein
MNIHSLQAVITNMEEYNKKLAEALISAMGKTMRLAQTSMVLSTSADNPSLLMPHLSPEAHNDLLTHPLEIAIWLGEAQSIIATMLVNNLVAATPVEMITASSVTAQPEISLTSLIQDMGLDGSDNESDTM